MFIKVRKDIAKYCICQKSSDFTFKNSVLVCKIYP